jgi:sulfotransferase
MDKKYHFISGLPRSGSTLLVAILNQNPRFHAEITNALQPCYGAILPASRATEAFLALQDQEKIKKILRAVVDAYYYDVDKEVIFNVNRSWISILDQLDITHKDSKIICCVRSINWILDSYERAYNQRGLSLPALYDQKYGNAHSRARDIFPDGALYKNYYDLMQAYYGPFKNKLCIIEYDDLVKSPKEMIDKIYDFIGEEKFSHNFDEVLYDSEQYDNSLGFPGLHKVKPKVEYVERKPILPPEIFDKFKGMEFWRN